MRKRGFGVNANSTDPDQVAEIYSLIRNFAILRNVLHYLMVLCADSEGQDQTAIAQADLDLHCTHMPEDTF